MTMFVAEITVLVIDQIAAIGLFYLSREYYHYAQAVFEHNRLRGWVYTLMFLVMSVLCVIEYYRVLYYFFGEFNRPMLLCFWFLFLFGTQIKIMHMWLCESYKHRKLVAGFTAGAIVIMYGGMMISSAYSLLYTVLGDISWSLV